MIILLPNDQRWTVVTDFTNVCHKFPHRNSIWDMNWGVLIVIQNLEMIPQIFNPFFSIYQKRSIAAPCSCMKVDPCLFASFNSFNFF